MGLEDIDESRWPISVLKGRAESIHHDLAAIVILKNAPRKTRRRLNRDGGSCYWPLRRRKSEMTIESDRPDQVSPQRGENQQHVRDIEKSEKQNEIWQEAAPNNEFSVPAEVQKRIRPPALRLRLPDSEELLRTPIGQPVPLEASDEEA